MVKLHKYAKKDSQTQKTVIFLRFKNTIYGSFFYLDKTFPKFFIKQYINCLYIEKQKYYMLFKFVFSLFFLIFEKNHTFCNFYKNFSVTIYFYFVFF